MKRTYWLGIAVLCCAVTPLGAQTCPLNLDNLASKAKEVVDIDLDSSVLQLAGRFLSSGDKDQSEAKNLLNGLKSICVRNYEFAKDGEYTPDDLQRVRNQLRAPLWSRIVHTQERNESSDIFTRTEGGKVTGFALISAEAKELHLVYIDGPVDLDKLSKFGGQFGIPSIPALPGVKKPSK